MNNSELYHYGVLGMKWGHRKARFKAYKKDRQNRKKFKQKQKQEQYEKMVKDNNSRVRTYGKGWVKTANRLQMVGTAYGASIAAGIVGGLGRNYLNNNKGNTTRELIGSAAVIGSLGAIGGIAINRIAKLHKDNKLTNDYEYRQYLAKKKK